MNLLEGKYLEKGIEIKTDYDGYEVREVHLKFDAETWIGLINAEGELLGRCCAVVSNIRDFLIKAAREDGWIDVEDLFDVTTLIQDHHAECEPGHPLLKIVELWDAVKADVPKQKFRRHSGKILDAVTTLGMTCREISWEHLIGHANREEKFGGKVITTLSLARLIPALRTVVAKLDELKLEPFEGFAICKADTILENNLGAAIFETKKLAQQVVDHYQPEFEPFKIRQVQISAEAGVKFL